MRVEPARPIAARVDEPAMRKDLKRRLVPLAGGADDRCAAGADEHASRAARFQPEAAAGQVDIASPVPPRIRASDLQRARAWLSVEGPSRRLGDGHLWVLRGPAAACDQRAREQER